MPAYFTQYTTAQSNIRSVRIITGSETLTNDDDVVLVDFSSPITIYLPAAPVEGLTIYIKDANGTCGSGGSNLTLDGNGTTIDGDSTFLINRRFANIVLLYDSSEWKIL